MKYLNEILLLLDNVISCGESMAKIGRLLNGLLPEIAGALPQKEKEEQAAELKAVPEEASSTPAYTFKYIRKAFSAKSHDGYTAQVKELISKYGADRLSDVREEDYPALMADLEVLE